MLISKKRNTIKTLRDYCPMKKGGQSQLTLIRVSKLLTLNFSYLLGDIVSLSLCEWYNSFVDFLHDTECHSLLSLLASCSFCNLNRLRQTLFKGHNLFFYSLERNCISVFNKIDSVLLVLKNRFKLILFRVICWL